MPPAYLRKLRVLVLNRMYPKLKEVDATQEWVRVATGDPDCTTDAVDKAVTLWFGDKRVSYDPSDPEANKRAVAEGYVVVTGSQLNKSQWQNIRRAESITPAGRLFPSPEPYSPKGDALNVIPESEWTAGMRRVVSYARQLGKILLETNIKVTLADEPEWGFSATYGNSQLTLNIAGLGQKWFDAGITEDVDCLLIHEFGHHYSKDHLSSDYHDALCRLGAKLKRTALEQPERLIA